MKKNTKIIVAVVVILLMIIGGCIYGFVLEKNEVGTPSQDNTQTEPVTPSKPEKPDDTQQETPAVQPENPNPTGGESAVIYVPDEQSESLTPVGTDVADDSDKALVDALIKGRATPGGRGGRFLLARGRRTHARHERRLCRCGSRFRHGRRGNARLLARQYLRVRAECRKRHADGRRQASPERS